MLINRLVTSSGFKLAGTSPNAPFDIITIRNIGNTAPKKKEYPLYRLLNTSYFIR